LVPPGIKWLVEGGRGAVSLKRYLRGDAGSTAAEYALILAIIGAAVAVATVGLGVAISGSLADGTGDFARSGSAASPTASALAASAATSPPVVAATTPVSSTTTGGTTTGHANHAGGNGKGNAWGLNGGNPKANGAGR